MGGPGSTRWDGHKKRMAVESCSCVSIRDLKEFGILRSKPFEWPWKGILPPPKAQDRRVFWPEDSLPRVPLPGDDWVAVEEWRPRYGGVSWWFHCSKCDRRCLRLYRPPGQHWFCCRQCWGLAYVSSQEAHKWDRGIFVGILCALTGVSPKEMEKEMRADYKKIRADRNFEK